MHHFNIRGFGWLVFRHLNSNKVNKTKVAAHEEDDVAGEDGGRRAGRGKEIEGGKGRKKHGDVPRLVPEIGDEEVCRPGGTTEKMSRRVRSAVTLWASV